MTSPPQVLPPLDPAPAQRRADEEHARWAVDADLRTRAESVIWTGERNDPPDAWVTLDGRRYATEITSIDLETAQGQRSLADSNRQHRAVGAAIDTLESESVVRGAWLLFSGHVTEVTETRRSVELQLRSFFSSGDHDQTNVLSLADEAGYRGTLRRVGVDCDGITLAADTGGGAGGRHLDHELRELLEDVIKGKSERMNDRGVPRPWILVIIDRYAWHRDRWMKCMPKTVSRFDAIYRVDGGRPATLVYSDVSFPSTR